MPITKDKLFDITAEASHRLHMEIKQAFDDGALEKYLSRIGMGDLLPEEKSFYTYNTYGKIIIFGDSQISENEILGCFKSFGIEKDRVELHLDYNQLKTYSFSKLHYNSAYALLFFGPVPHSTKDKGDAKSIISEIENKEGYPQIIKLNVGHKLKITKTNLKIALESATRSGYIEI